MAITIKLELLIRIDKKIISQVSDASLDILCNLRTRMVLIWSKFTELSITIKFFGP